MAENSKIEWCDHTFNPWIGCTAVSPACHNCYAETQDNHRKWTADGWGKGKPRNLTSAANWKKPFAWDRKAAKDGTRPKVFCASLADVFDEEVPDKWRDLLFEMISETPNLDWLVLTKRPGKAFDFLTTGDDGPMLREWLPNVWMGCTIENQDIARPRLNDLLAMGATKQFVSSEPLLGPLDLAEWLPELDWVITGGESGPKARPSHPDWFRAIRDQCAAAGVPYLHKQNGEWLGVSELKLISGGAGPGFGDFDHCQFDQNTDTIRIGKKAAGRLLDGKQHDGRPDNFTDSDGTIYEMVDDFTGPDEGGSFVDFPDGSVIGKRGPE